VQCVPSMAGSVGGRRGSEFTMVGFVWADGGASSAHVGSVPQAGEATSLAARDEAAWTKRFGLLCM
jgi:hypothetical protein